MNALLEASETDLIGECWEESGYQIRVDPMLDYQHAIDTLAHEWAHLKRYELDPSLFSAHDDGFWLLYGELYRAIYPSEDDE